MRSEAQLFSPEEKTVTQVLRRNAESQGDRCAISTVSGATISYSELDERSSRLAGHLCALGIKPEDTVLICLPDCIEYIVLFAALAKICAVEVPVNTAYRGVILAHVVNDSSARIAIIADTYLERFEEIADQIRGLKRVLVFSKTDESDPLVDRKTRQRWNVEPYQGLYHGASAPYSMEPAVQDLLAIMYTSGTTGVSKGVMVTNGHAFEYAHGDALVFGTDSEDRVYTAGLPLCHATGQWSLTYSTFIVGGSVVMRDRFSRTQFWNDIRTNRCTATMLLGAISNFLWLEEPRPEDSDNPLEKVGMFPLITEHQEFAERFNVKISTCFAMTELPPVCIKGFDDVIPNNKCVGAVRNDKFEVSIVDESDIPLGVGEVGEIVVRPREPWIMMSGYWKRPDATIQAWRNFWFHTGDAGYLDTEGRLYFTDRLTDTIRRRGENISSMEVEEQVNSFPGTAECAVYPAKDEHGDEEVCVAIVPKEGAAAPDPEKLVRFLSEKLPYFMVPRFVMLLAELPKTQTGKISKVDLKSKGIVPEMWDRAKAGIQLKR